SLVSRSISRLMFHRAIRAEVPFQIDTSTPMGKMIFTVLGAVAELERNLIKERVQMGISRARKQGKQLGRPKRIFDRAKARMLVQTMSIREAARQLGVSRGVLQRAVAD